MELVKLIGVFVLIILLLRFKVNLGVTMTVAAIVLGLLFKLNIIKIGNVFIQAITSTSTIRTALLLTIIMFLENIMRKKHLLEKIVNSLKIIIGDYRIVMPILPAFLGLLPSAGGAMFSAPLVADACEDGQITAERKSVINFWYRHVWECVLPLYPAVIITSEVLKVNLAQFMAVLYPFSILCVVLGLPYLLYKVTPPREKSIRHMANKISYIELVQGMAPMFIILFLFFTFKIDILFSILIVIIGLLFIYRYNWEEFSRSMREAFSIKIIALVLGIMIFKSMLEATAVINELPSIFDQIGIPHIAVVIVLPFMVGFLTGMSQAYAAVAFPILMGLSPEINLRLMALGFVSGFVGIMLSPMHLCLILTVDYFKAKLEKVIAMMVVPSTIIICCGYLLYRVF